MTVCARCGKEAYGAAQKCPNCDYRPQKSMQVTGAVISVIGILTIPFLIGVPITAFGIYRLLKGSNLTIESTYGT